MRHRVLMVTDFFYPNFGGVENHVYQLSQCLMALGHKVGAELQPDLIKAPRNTSIRRSGCAPSQVVVMTHAYGDCCGVRWLTNGLKATLPTFGGTMRMLRLIIAREGITLVHAHQAFSTMGLEACLQARTLGLKVVFTDHSLFGFADAVSIVMNRLLECVLADVQHVICVSHTSRENTALRACLAPANISVIPNAVDTGPRGFSPAPPELRRWPQDGLQDEVVIVALSRLVYRKGIDLLALAVPHICRTYPNVRFIIGGGGPKSRLLEAVIDECDLQGRVTLEGPVPHERACEFLRRGHIFVNASLTEAFCMAIAEAAACGLLVVSTRVGGVPEVLPPDMIELAEPTAEGLVLALEAALRRVALIKPDEQHARVRAMYSWPNVAQRTARVYDLVCEPADNKQQEEKEGKSGPQAQQQQAQQQKGGGDAPQAQQQQAQQQGAGVPQAQQTSEQHHPALQQKQHQQQQQQQGAAVASAGVTGAATTAKVNGTLAGHVLQGTGANGEGKGGSGAATGAGEYQAGQQQQVPNRAQAAANAAGIDTTAATANITAAAAATVPPPPLATGAAAVVMPPPPTGAAAAVPAAAAVVPPPPPPPPPTGAAAVSASAGSGLGHAAASEAPITPALTSSVGPVVHQAPAITNPAVNPPVSRRRTHRRAANREAGPSAAVRMLPPLPPALQTMPAVHNLLPAVHLDSSTPAVLRVEVTLGDPGLEAVHGGVGGAVQPGQQGSAVPPIMSIRVVAPEGMHVEVAPDALGGTTVPVQVVQAGQVPPLPRYNLRSARSSTPLQQTPTPTHQQILYPPDVAAPSEPSITLPAHTIEGQQLQGEGKTDQGVSSQQQQASPPSSPEQLQQSGGQALQGEAADLAPNHRHEKKAPGAGVIKGAQAEPATGNQRASVAGMHHQQQQGSGSGDSAPDQQQHGAADHGPPHGDDPSHGHHGQVPQITWVDNLAGGRAALLDRLARYHACGGWAGSVFCFIAVLLHLWWHVLVWLQPVEDIEPALDWPHGQI